MDLTASMAIVLPSLNRVLRIKKAYPTTLFMLYAKISLAISGLELTMGLTFLYMLKTAL
jgi:hypothetical protein